MGDKLRNKKKIIIFLVIIILIQVLYKIYVGYHKEDFFVDELFSYGLMNYPRAYIFENEDFCKRIGIPAFPISCIYNDEEEKGMV